MTPQLRERIEREMRCFLRLRGPRPPGLVGARIDLHRVSYTSVLAFLLTDGATWHTDLGCAHSLPSTGDARLFSRECVTAYSRLYEDHILEADLAAARDRVERMAMLGAPAAAVDRAMSEHREYERRIRLNHARRRPPPSMSYQSLTSFTSGAPSEPAETLTLESMRAMMWATMQIPNRYIDDVAAFGYAVLGVDMGGRVGDDKAQARALELLKGHLTPAQLAQYEAHQHFEVIGGDTGKRYRIRHGRQMNIDELDDAGKKVCGWCFLPQGQLPAGDVMLAQKISLECDETAALKVANRFSERLDVRWFEYDLAVARAYDRHLDVTI